MIHFTQHTLESSPACARHALDMTKQAFGMIPNLQKFMAESPALLNAYSEVWDIFHKQATLTPAEQQIVLLTASYENNCEYCMSGHSFIATKAGVDPTTLEELRAGRPLTDARLQVLRAFTGNMVRDRGWVSEHDIADFLSAGFSKAQVFEVITGVALKAMSNYTNHVTHTPLDAFMAGTKWTRPPGGYTSPAQAIATASH